MCGCHGGRFRFREQGNFEGLSQSLNFQQTFSALGGRDDGKYMQVDGFAWEDSEGRGIDGKGWWNLDGPDAFVTPCVFEGDWGEEMFIGRDNGRGCEIAGDSEQRSRGLGVPEQQTGDSEIFGRSFSSEFEQSGGGFLGEFSAAHGDLL